MKIRTHRCGELTRVNVGQQVVLNGWVQRRRDHGTVLFIDLRDHYGLTQCVIDGSSPLFQAVEDVRVESVVTVTGVVVQTWQTTPSYAVNYGDLDVCQSSGNLFIVSNSETTMAEFTPTGTFVAEYALPAGSNDGAGLAIVDGTNTAWIGTPSGTAFLLGGIPCN